MIQRFLGRLRRRLGDAQAWRSARRAWDAAPYDPAPQALDDARGTLERILTENILPFWYPRTIDAENGGFRINHDERGDWVGHGSNRHVVRQSRMAWFFARLTNSFGEWHRRISPNGVSSGKKSGDEAGAWKTPYHNGRAIIRCLELVSEEQTRPSQPMQIAAPIS